MERQMMSQAKSLEQQNITLIDAIPPKDLQIYHQALKFSQLLVPDEINTRNVKIYEDDHLHQIYTTKNNSSNPHLVMVHGFGGTSLCFVRTFKELSKHYQIHAIDLFGTGYSSLGNFKQSFTNQQTINYYIDGLEQWRKNIGIQTFQLVGHSFGGYLSVCYIKKYKDRVKRLVLLSPAGLRNYKSQEEDLQRSFCCKKALYSIVKGIYNKNVRPSSLITNCLFGGIILNRVLTNRLRLQGQEKELWKQYWLNIAEKRQESSQTGFYKVFEWPLNPPITIMEIIASQKIDIPIEMYFGGPTDWMYENCKIQTIIDTLPKNMICQRIEKADHQIVFYAPNEVVDKILRHSKTKQEIKKLNDNKIYI